MGEWVFLFSSFWLAPMPMLQSCSSWQRWPREKQAGFLVFTFWVFFLGGCWGRGMEISCEIVASLQGTHKLQASKVFKQVTGVTELTKSNPILSFICAWVCVLFSGVITVQGNVLFSTVCCSFQIFSWTITVSHWAVKTTQSMLTSLQRNI